MLPPLVSHKTIISAPASAAARITCRVYSGSAFQPSKKCSASKITRRPWLRSQAMLSRIMATFSSRPARSTSVAWKADDLPTIVITSAPEANKRGQPLVLLDPDALAPRHAESADLGLLEVQLADPLEVLAVLVVGGRVSPLDEVHAQLIEPLGQQQFVLEREADAFGLGPVPKGRVVDLNATHDVFLPVPLRARSGRTDCQSVLQPTKKPSGLGDLRARLDRTLPVEALKAPPPR